MAIGLMLPGTLSAQADSATVAAGRHYAAGAFRRFMLGTTYRALWTAPVRVPVVNLETFAGGLRPVKAGGGNTTRSLRLVAASGKQYVFRFVDKDGVTLPPRFEGTILETVGRDQISANHPGAAIVVAPLLEAAGVLHVTPALSVLPDDPALGEFRREFAGRLGMLEEYPSMEGERGFANAAAIIDSDSLRPMLDQDPATQVDAAAFLTVRLMDMLINDWDRHPGNWKWARLGPARESPWLPIPRDRDKAFISFGGIVAAAGKVSANFVTFKTTYPSMKGLTWNSLEMDRRLLAGLEQRVFDSVAAALMLRVTDAVIDDAVQGMTPEYRERSPGLGPKLKQRRDSLPSVARRFYQYLAGFTDVHATDAADHARVTRLPSGQVEVRLQSAGGETYFQRRFEPGDTEEIRLYLHGGDDTALILGEVHSSILVRIIGGNGTNHLTDSSTVGGRQEAHLYDVGTVTGVSYGRDTLFNRRSWVREGGKLVAPVKDYGGKVGPMIGLGIDGDLGVTLRLGLQQFRYAFRRHPYARWVYTTGEYSTAVEGFRVISYLDKRRESSVLHFTARAQMSELEVTSFQGLGNTSPGVPDSVAEVRQRQWSFSPALAISFGRRSDLSLGPVIQYNTTSDEPGRFITTTRPYGSGRFGQAGLRLGLYHDVRDQAKDPRRGILVDLNAAWYPGVWDVASAFGSVSGSAAFYYTLPIPVRPIFVVRGGGKQLFGDFPFHESAFIGGRATVRRLDRQRYAGDAALAGTAELQVPIAKFPLILPLDLGIYGYGDAGRVYVNGSSPGGWHSGAGVGVWIGVLSPATALNLEVGDRRGRTLVRVRTGLAF